MVISCESHVFVKLSLDTRFSKKNFRAILKIVNTIVNINSFITQIPYMCENKNVNENVNKNIKNANAHFSVFFPISENNEKQTILESW